MSPVYCITFISYEKTKEKREMRETTSIPKNKYRTTLYLNVDIGRNVKKILPVYTDNLKTMIYHIL